MESDPKEDNDKVKLLPGYYFVRNDLEQKKCAFFGFCF